MLRSTNSLGHTLYMVVLKGYFWFFVQISLLEVLKGFDPGLTTCKTRALLAFLSFLLLEANFCQYGEPNLVTFLVIERIDSEIVHFMPRDDDFY